MPVTWRGRLPRPRARYPPFGAVAQLLTITVVSVQIWMFCVRSLAQPNDLPTPDLPVVSNCVCRLKAIVQ